MSTTSKFTTRDLLEKIISFFVKREYEIWSQFGIVKEVNIENTYCDVELQDSRVVRCFLQSKTSTGGLIIPTVESSVVITWLSKVNAIITAYSDIDFIYMGFLKKDDENKKAFSMDIEKKEIELYREDEKIVDIHGDFENKKLRFFVEDEDKMFLDIDKEKGIKLYEDGKKSVLNAGNDKVSVYEDGDASKTTLEITTDSVIIYKGSTAVMEIKSGGEVTFNGGQNGGLVKVQSMVDWMMKVYQDMQMIKTTFSTGAPVGLASPVGPVTGTLGIVSFSPQTEPPVKPNFENDKVKH